MPTEENKTTPEKRPLSVKLLWFAGLWLAGLLVTAGIAYSLRALLFAG